MTSDSAPSLAEEHRALFLDDRLLQLVARQLHFAALVAGGPPLRLYSDDQIRFHPESRDRLERYRLALIGKARLGEIFRYCSLAELVREG